MTVDIVNAHRNLIGLHDLTTPISGMVCHLWASTCYDQLIYQIASLYLHQPRRYNRRHRMSKMGWFGVVRGHSKSLEIAPFDRAHEFLLAFHSNYVCILHRLIQNTDFAVFLGSRAYIVNTPQGKNGLHAFRNNSAESEPIWMICYIAT